MTYDFHFDKKSITLLAGCCLVFAALLVSAGFLLGRRSASHAVPVNAAEKIAAIKASTVGPKPPAIQPIAIPSSTATQSDSAKPTPTPASNQGSSAPSATGPSDSASAAPPAGELPAIHDRKPKYCLQFGAFQDKANADAKVKTLKEAGITAMVFPTQDSGGHSWFAVRAGSYDGLAAATDAARAVSDQTGNYVIIRRSGSF